VPGPEGEALGAVDPATQLEVTVLVRPRRSLEDLESRLSTGSVLSREEFAEQYGADAQDLERVAAFARAHGLHVVESSPAQRRVVLRGPAAKIGEAFGVTLARYRGADGREFRAATADVKLPPEVADIVQGVFGLDDRPVARHT
jgi:kumamolisin